VYSGASPNAIFNEERRIKDLIEQPSNPKAIFHGMSELSLDLQAFHDHPSGPDFRGYNTLLGDLANATNLPGNVYRLQLGDMNPKTGTFNSAQLVTDQGLPFFSIAQPGDTVWGIANSNFNFVHEAYRDVDSYCKTLLRVNGIEDPRQLKVGTSIFLADAG
jgi:hypothetical protein